MTDRMDNMIKIGKHAIGMALMPLGFVMAISQDLPAADRASLIRVNEIAKYVYPANSPASPGKMKFMPDGESYLMLDESGKKIVRYNTASGKEEGVVLDASHTRESSVMSIEDFTISPDGTKLLIYTGKEPVYRHSFKASYYVFEIKRNILRPLSKTYELQQSPVFSPDSRMVAFVVDNNIHIKKIDYDSEVQVTTDGLKNSIINGLPDWTYEEEFAMVNAMAWSPDGSTLCYLKFDESNVPTFTFSLYEGWCEPQQEYALYPGAFTYKYPVAGKPNSRVGVYSYDVDNRKTKEIAFKDPEIEYIPKIAFGGGTEPQLMVVTLNRAQNRMEIYASNPKSTVSKSILVEEAKAWLNPMAYEDISFDSDGFTVLSERSGVNQAYKYTYGGQLQRQQTASGLDVTAYYGEDASGRAFYQAVPASTGATPANAINRVVYRTDKTGQRTEALSPETGWGSAVFTGMMNYYVVNYSDALTPPVHTLFAMKGKKDRGRILEDNSRYSSNYQGVAKKEFFTMQSDGTTLNGYMIKPAGFDASKKYPVIMWQYSGPGSQEAVNRWKMDWDYYAAKEGFVVICVDGRGTGGRGTQFRDVVYKRLGYYETIDQLNVAKYAASLPFVDGARIGIAGWSYGGYETLMCATSTECPFKAAVAIAPVTSWRYYDTVYTERYMLTPQENSEGYDAGAPVMRADKMNCRLLIMSGTADDNVHLSNTIEFVGKLQEADRYCDMFLFPNMNHSIYGCDARALVYGRMVEYFKVNL